MQNRPHQQPPASPELEKRRDELWDRLESGYQRIEAGLNEGRDVTTWEELWIALLNEYEQVCEQLQRDLAI